jgi:hypothetical protein
LRKNKFNFSGGNVKREVKVIIYKAYKSDIFDSLQNTVHKIAEKINSLKFCCAGSERGDLVDNKNKLILYFCD